MDIGVCVASHIQDQNYVVQAEALGFSHAWFADSQMIWSDCYAALALAAVNTSRIKLGTGVAISGTRPAPVNAAGIATINVLAPGRTFFGVGAGNTALRIMGFPPQRIRQLDAYLKEIRPLLRGEESDINFQGQRSLVKHVMPDKGFVNFEDPIPMYVSGFGPRSLGLAGKHGDGAVLALATSPGGMEAMWQLIEAGSESAGRILDRTNYYTSALTTVTVLDDGETLDSPRVRHECGAFAMAALHYAYDQYRNFGQSPPGVYADIWEDYRSLLESFPPERRHQRIHAGHNCWVLPEEEKFITPASIAASCLVGTRDQLLEKLFDLGKAGLNQIMVLPAFDPRYEVLERLGKDIIPYLDASP